MLNCGKAGVGVLFHLHRQVHVLACAHTNVESTPSIQVVTVILCDVAGRRGRRPKNLGEVKVEVMEAVSSTPTKPDVPEKGMSLVVVIFLLTGNSVFF